MSPRVAYWTSAFDSDMEAIASEVALLQRQFPRSRAWGLTDRTYARWFWGRGWSLHPRLHWLFRLATRLLEPVFQINHVFGSLGDWFYLESRKRRPTVLTLAAHSPPVGGDLLRRVDRFVVEHPGGVDELVNLGLERGRVSVILPPVDLERFRPEPPPDGPFTVLFASSPDKAGWLDARGVPVILDAASLRPNVMFRLLWRPWGDAAPVVRRWIRERGLANVRLEVGKWRDMSYHYRAAHVCIAPFTDATRAKPAPNSVIEGLACGRPALVTPTVGLADLIVDGQGGLTCPPRGDALAESLDRLQADWDHYSRAARSLAERQFGVGLFLQAYERLYGELLLPRTTAR